MIRDRFPQAAPSPANLSIDRETYTNFLKTQGGFGDLARDAALVLSGLDAEQLEQLGYAVIDDATGETPVFVPPAEVTQPAGT